jgi:outer membrane protein TolC
MICVKGTRLLCTFNALITFAMFTVSNNASAKTYTLGEVLSLTRNNSPELREWKATTAKAEHKANTVESAFDTTMYADTQMTNDKSDTIQTGAGDSREVTNSKIGFKRLFGTGTHLDLSYETQKQEFEYPEEAVTIDPSTGQPVQTFSTNVDPNPNFQNALNLTINQPLWRNFWANEVDLRQKVAKGHAIAPRFTFKMYEQQIQAQAEQLFWTYKKLKGQVYIANIMVKKSKKFASLMKKRTKMGRADQVDVAAAESALVNQEGTLLNLEVAEEETRKRIAYLINPQFPDMAYNSSADLSRNPLALSTKSRKEAFTRGSQNRYDLKMITQQIASAQSERKLANEIGKPTINLWSKISSKGLGEDNGAADEQVNEFKRNSVTVGLSFNMTLGRTESRSEIAASTSEVLKLQAKQASIGRDFRKEVDLAFTSLEASERQKNQTNKNVASLQKQLSEELRKFKQARSEEISAIRFEIEVLAAKTSRIEAMYKARIAESRIRHAMHEYPAEK